MESKSKSSASPGKIFIGGLPKHTQYDEFNKHFGKYGDIMDSVIMKDRVTGQPRGFGFITYADPSVVDKVFKDSHVFDGKQVEIKRTTPKGSSDSKVFKTKKIFVGGISTSLTEDELGGFFSKYGKILECQIIRDRQTNRSRGFGFVIFDSEELVDELVSNGNMIDMSGNKVEVKKAEPKKVSNPALGVSRPRSSYFPDISDGGNGPSPYRTPIGTYDGGYRPGPYTSPVDVRRVDGGYDGGYRPGPYTNPVGVRRRVEGRYRPGVDVSFNDWLNPGYGPCPPGTHDVGTVRNGYDGSDVGFIRRPFPGSSFSRPWDGYSGRYHPYAR